MTLAANDRGEFMGSKERVLMLLTVEVFEVSDIAKSQIHDHKHKINVKNNL